MALSIRTALGLLLLMAGCLLVRAEFAVIDLEREIRQRVSFFLNEVPGLYFVLGIVPRDQELAKAAANHSPSFFVDETALVTGVRALTLTTVNYLASAKTD